jgi:ABC-type phosphate/phosphonate transport system substrate-binding protein
VFYTNYELMVRALVQRYIDIAWNSPLAWLDTVRQLGSLPGDCYARHRPRSVSHIITKTQHLLSSVEDLAATVAVGAKDSPQATLIPLRWLQQHGLEPDEISRCGDSTC